jgi:peptide/nickel transport system substrate-binding protein
MILSRRRLLLALPSLSALPLLLGAVPGARAQGTSRGTVRIALGNGFPATLDASRSGGFTLLGMGETLMRLTPQMQLAPWLAQSLQQIDAVTWRIALRPEAVFWDGTPVTSRAVEESFRRIWETTPGNRLLLSDATQFDTSDAGTLVLRLAEPQSDLPWILASSEFEVHKVGEDRRSVLTGPYRPTSFRANDRMTLEAFPRHWGGAPPIARIEVLNVVDANARVLGLQAGDIDLIYGNPPALMQALPATFGKVLEPTTRIHYLPLNHRRPIFGDPAVRHAVAIGLDRQAILDAALSGAGAPLGGMFPTHVGLSVVETVHTNTAEAERRLDAAGWRRGPGGIRAKDGQRLSFTIHTWPNRSELTPIGVAVSGQLARLGFETRILEVRDVRGLMRGNDWDLTTFSNNTMSAGPQRIFLNTLLRGATDNYGGYANEALETTIRALRASTDAEQRDEFFRRAQQIVLDDAANIYLLAAPFGVAWRRDRVARYVFHPSDVFFIASDTLAAA